MSKVISILTAVLVVFLFSAESKPKASGTSEVESATLSQNVDVETQSKPAPKISPVEYLFDFGRVRQGDKVEHVFQVRNIGTADLVIKKATGD